MRRLHSNEATRTRAGKQVNARRFNLPVFLHPFDSQPFIKVPLKVVLSKSQLLIMIRFIHVKTTVGSKRLDVY